MLQNLGNAIIIDTTVILYKIYCMRPVIVSSFNDTHSQADQVKVDYHPPGLFMNNLHWTRVYHMYNTELHDGWQLIIAPMITTICIP